VIRLSGKYITPELHKVRCEIGKHRTKRECIELSEKLYEIVRADVLKAEKNIGRDYTTFALDRKIGKTYNLMRLAAEFDYPMIVHDGGWAKVIQKESKNIYGKKVSVLTICSMKNRLDGTRCDVLLKDEMVSMEELRDKLNEYGYRLVSIVGIN
jgi:hypothetical protein